MQIDTFQNIFLILLSFGLIFAIWQLIKRIDLEDTFFQTVENAVTKAKEEIKKSSWIEFDKYITAIRNEYDVIYGELDKQKKKIEELTKLLNNQAEAIRQHYTAQNEEIERLHNELHKTQNMLSRCKKKLQRIKDAHKIT